MGMNMKRTPAAYDILFAESVGFPDRLLSLGGLSVGRFAWLTPVIPSVTPILRNRRTQKTKPTVNIGKPP